MKPHTRISAIASALGYFLLLTAIPVLSQTPVQTRVLRLSFVQGRVTLERPDVQGWAEAPANTPLQQGFKLSTGENSFAEVQFENGGALRLGEQSLIELTKLGWIPEGGKTSRVSLRQGYATFHALASGAAEMLQVETPLGRLTADAGAEFRVDLDQGMERVEVLNGSVEEESNLGSLTVEKNSVLLMQPGAPEPTVVSQGITRDDWDQWVADRESHVEVADAEVFPETNSTSAEEPAYGRADLAQNGDWTVLDGGGRAWIPKTNPNWSPYTNGRWCWYPGWGFTWIGSEPWGWLPYHYGEWEVIPGRGWAWFPGNLRKWSPARVTWYQGSNWVGWVPRSHHGNVSASCSGTVCGGGVVSAGTFHQGGNVDGYSRLGINPTAGIVVNSPRINPSTAVMLTGAPMAFPASQSHSSQWTVSRPQNGGPWASTPTSGPLGPRRGAGMSNRNPSIVYDPQQGSYINSHHAAAPQVMPAFPSEKARPITSSPRANPSSSSTAPIQPSPSASPQWIVPPLGGQGHTQALQGGFASPPAPTVPNNPNGPHPSPGPGQPGSGQSGGAPAGSNRSTPWAPAGGQTGNNRGGGWAPAGGAGHSTPPPPPSPTSGKH